MSALTSVLFSSAVGVPDLTRAGAPLLMIDVGRFLALRWRRTFDVVHCAHPMLALICLVPIIFSGGVDARQLGVVVLIEFYILLITQDSGVDDDCGGSDGKRAS